MSNDDVFADEASSNIQNFSRQSPSVTQCDASRVACHESRLGQGDDGSHRYYWIRFGWSPNIAWYYSVRMDPLCALPGSRMARVWTLKSFASPAAARARGHMSLLAPGCTHLIVLTKRRKSFEINLKVGSRLVEVLFESFLLVVSCRYRGLTTTKAGATVGPVPTVIGELEARKFWKDQYVHFCSE